MGTRCWSAVIGELEVIERCFHRDACLEEPALTCMNCSGRERELLVGENSICQCFCCAIAEPGSEHG